MRVGKRQSAAGLRHEIGQLRHHEGDENDDERRAGRGEEGRINERLLHAVAEIFSCIRCSTTRDRISGQRAARFAGADHVHIKRREDARKIAQAPARNCVRRSATDAARSSSAERADVSNRFSSTPRLSSSVMPACKRWPSCSVKMQQLAVRNLEILCRRCAARRGLTVERRRLRRHRFDPNRDAILLLDLPDGDGAISDIEHAFDEAALGIARRGKQNWGIESGKAMKLARLICRVQSGG